MWLVAASGNGTPGIERAAEILRESGTALDAVEEATRLVEANAQDDRVGLGGLPNVLGQVQLDASIMDGRTLASGAVGALEGYRHPISVARHVMERTAHVLLVGQDAARFAAEMGAEPGDLLTEEAQRKWWETLRQVLPEEEIGQLPQRRDLLSVVQRILQLPHGTVNLLARDQHGDIASAVSTSGWPWKYPGRLGDSPIIGAGNYADNRYGAAACTGHGELAIRCGTARCAVLYMKMGMSVEEACQEAMRDLQPLLQAHGGGMNILAMDREGRFTGISSEPKPHSYLAMTHAHSAAQQVEYIRLPGS